MVYLLSISEFLNETLKYFFTLETEGSNCD